MALHLAILAHARGRRPRAKQRRLRPIRLNHKAEFQYRNALYSLVTKCRHVVESSLHEIERHWPRPTEGDSVRAADGIGPTVEQWIGANKRKLGKLDTWAKRMAGLAAEANKDNVDARLTSEIQRTIGVDVGHVLRGDGQLLQSMRSATETNIELIKSIPDQYFDRVTETITSGWTQGVRWESLVDQIQEDGGVTERRAKFIARDQTAKMNEMFNQERCKQVGIERGEWLCSLDERTRPNHAAMEGVVFDLNGDGPLVNDDGEHCFPGDDYNCRCTFAPVIDMEEADAGSGEADELEEAA